MNKEIKLCFVCAGNTCRSIMAERIAKKKVKSEKIESVKIFSRGLAAKGENITENARLALKSISCSCVNRKSVPLKKPNNSTLYIAMTENIKNAINARVISAKDLIGQDINDPFDKDIYAYLFTINQIVKLVDVLFEKILKLRS